MEEGPTISPVGGGEDGASPPSGGASKLWWLSNVMAELIP